MYAVDKATTSCSSHATTAIFNTIDEEVSIHRQSIVRVSELHAAKISID